MRVVCHSQHRCMAAHVEPQARACASHGPCRCLQHCCYVSSTSTGLPPGQSCAPATAHLLAAHASPQGAGCTSPAGPWGLRGRSARSRSARTPAHTARQVLSWHCSACRIATQPVVYLQARAYYCCMQCTWPGNACRVHVHRARGAACNKQDGMHVHWGGVTQRQLPIRT